MRLLATKLTRVKEDLYQRTRRSATHAGATHDYFANDDDPCNDLISPFWRPETSSGPGQAKISPLFNHCCRRQKRPKLTANSRVAGWSLSTTSLFWLCCFVAVTRLDGNQDVSNVLQRCCTKCSRQSLGSVRCAYVCCCCCCCTVEIKLRLSLSHCQSSLTQLLLFFLNLFYSIIVAMIIISLGLSDIYFCNVYRRFIVGLSKYVLYY